MRTKAYVLAFNILPYWNDWLQRDKGVRVEGRLGAPAERIVGAVCYEQPYCRNDRPRHSAHALDIFFTLHCVLWRVCFVERICVISATFRACKSMANRTALVQGQKYTPSILFIYLFLCLDLRAMGAAEPSS